jgi:Zn-dependent protease with chaperone function
MPLSLHLVYPLLILIALVPGALSWWSGRQLAGRLNDPALPELLAEHRRRQGMVLVGVMCALGFVAASGGVNVTAAGIVGGLLTAYAGCVAAAYPLRRVLYEETWTFSAYLLYSFRALFGLFGFWLLIAALPAAAAIAGRLDWFVGLALGSLLVWWNVRYADILRYCLRTQPLADGALLAECRRLAIACNLPGTRFERIQLSGGVIANALALPSRRTPTVLFTDTVLERFEQDEILAVCAHELAHFEYYHPARLRRLNIASYTIVALGAIAMPATRIAGAEWGVFMTTLWFAAVACTIAMRARGKQQQETTCDLRAVALTGNPEALVRALTKLYTIARMPRRLAAQTEQASTHPSLARRIRDIRRAGECVPASLPAAAAFVSEDGQAVVTFRDDGLGWAVRDVATHDLRYEHLSELRVEYRGGRGARLLARGTKAGSWEMRVRHDDVRDIQAVLDVVDGRLGEGRRPAGIHPGVARLIILAAATIALTLSQSAVGFVALLSSARPTVPLLVGTGLSVIAAAALLVGDHGASALLAGSLPLLGIGIVFLGIAWAGRKDQRERTRWPLVVLTISAAFFVVTIATGSLDAVALHHRALGFPSATVLLVALAGTLAASPTRRERVAGLAVAITALAIVGMASTAFLDRFGNDPLLVEAPPVRWFALPSSPTQTFDVPVDTQRIDLSPDGRYLAIRRRNVTRDGEYSVDLQVGRTGGSLIPIRADDVAFVNDEQLLLVRSLASGTTLQAERLNANREVLWARAVENLSEPVLSIDRATGGWNLLGWDDEDAILRVRGVIGRTEVEETRWPVSPDDDGYVAALTSSESDALLMKTRYDRGGLARAIPWRWPIAYLLLPTTPVAKFVTVNRLGRETIAESKLDVDCAADLLPGGALACTAYDGRRTRIVSVSPARGRVEALASVNGRFISDQSPVRGWLTGWVAARPVAIRLETRDGFHMAHMPGIVRLLPVGPDRLASLETSGDHQTVRVYQLPAAADYLQSLGFQPSR